METQTEQEKQAKRLNFLEEKERVRKWAKRLSNEDISYYLTFCRDELRGYERDILILEERKRREVLKE
jgi:hypothetical protein